MAYDKWEWKIDHWLIISTRYSLPAPWLPSTIVCRHGKQPSLVSHQSLVQEVEHNLSAIQVTLITRLKMHAQMYFSISTWIFILPCHRFRPKRYTISATWFTNGSTELVRTKRWPNLSMSRAAVMRTSLITSQRSQMSSLAILLILSAALLLLLKLACDTQLFCLWVGLPLPAAASPFPASTAIASARTSQASPTWPALRIRD